MACSWLVTARIVRSACVATVTFLKLDTVSLLLLSHELPQREPDGSSVAWQPVRSSNDSHSLFVIVFDDDIQPPFFHNTDNIHDAPVYYKCVVVQSLPG